MFITFLQNHNNRRHTKCSEAQQSGGILSVKEWRTEGWNHRTWSTESKTVLRLNATIIENIDLWSSLQYRIHDQNSPFFKIEMLRLILRNFSKSNFKILQKLPYSVILNTAYLDLWNINHLPGNTSSAVHYFTTISDRRMDGWRRERTDSQASEWTKRAKLKVDRWNNKVKCFPLMSSTTTTSNQVQPN